MSAPGRAPIRPGNIPGGSGRSGKDSRRSRGERDGFPTTHYANWNGVQVVAGSNPVAPTTPNTKPGRHLGGWDCVHPDRVPWKTVTNSHRGRAGEKDTGPGLPRARFRPRAALPLHPPNAVDTVQGHEYFLARHRELRRGIWPDDAHGNLDRPPRCQSQPGNRNDVARRSNPWPSRHFCFPETPRLTLTSLRGRCMPPSEPSLRPGLRCSPADSPGPVLQARPSGNPFPRATEAEGGTGIGNGLSKSKPGSRERDHALDPEGRRRPETPADRPSAGLRAGQAGGVPGHPTGSLDSRSSTRVFRVAQDSDRGGLVSRGDWRARQGLSGRDAG